ncbi:MFS transporter superfamily [Arabidopsis suecica]|uniref:MFS transporter superfamily n=1 Tax=Arabidopsis suecica TaxID=45249 RepID=A0A8T1XZU3_ARASU|nr:MFS transporter superfamily [Arabidopsis suecica]
MDKSWVWLPRNSIEYEKGATTFVYSSARSLGDPKEMFCPCKDCRNLCHQPVERVLEHLVIKGMDQKYKRNECWSKHGDIRTDKSDAEPRREFEAFDLIRTAFYDGEDHSDSQNQNGDDSEEAETKEESDFRKKLKVSAIMGLYRIKVKSGMSENYFDQLLSLVHDMLPGENVLPKSTNEIKKFLKVFGFGYETIHACKNDCILYRKEYELKDSCPRCSASRWERDKHTGEEKKGIPAKVLRYFPIKDRFRRMFRSKKMAEDLRWHFNNASEDGTMRHPVDSLAWAQVNNKWPEFAAERRNLRLGLSTDGMNPFSIQNTKYSTWPVLLVNYNMAPTMCMKAENIMLTLLIPGPTAPSNNIDVYLAPLIDDLKDLWSEGIQVYDSFLKENFTLKAMLLWSISDYPALGTLAGCKVKGKQACNVCGKDTPFKWLKFSRKHVYLSNRKRLSPGHHYRRRRGWFDNTIEEGTPSRIQTGEEIFEILKDFRNDFGRPLERKSKRKRTDLEEDDMVSQDEYDEDTDQWRWKKLSILFQLPYWKYLPVRHNIDVMHVEKNVSDALVSILMQNAKSKDGLKARKDLEDMGIRSNLHTQLRGKRTYLPPAAYWLSKEEKRRFCSRLARFRGPDGYCANISNCVSVDPPVIGGLKSHDHHVLLQNLLPVALRGLLPKGPRVAISRLCNYFSRLCQRVIDPEKLITLESELVETLCQLERYFPPSLFDIMFHLPIHLAREARLGGPVHFRWMYPFERYMKTLKAYVKNFARPEACMAEGYLARECMAFCLEFLQNSLSLPEAVNRNEDVESNSLILEGRTLQKATQVTLTSKEREIAHRYVLMNMAVMDPYINLHLEELQATDARCMSNETLLWKMLADQFLEWIKEKIPTNSTEHSTQLRWLAFGPRHIAQTYKGFVINGHRFHTDDMKRKTQNSGVTYEAFSMCRSSAKDTRLQADIVTYFGVIKEIILLDYHMFQVPIFKCHWANKGNGVKEEDGFTLVNLHLNQSAFLQDPYILAAQAKQVFYSREDDSSPWYVVMKAPPRGYHELETEEEFAAATIVTQDNVELGNESDDESFYVRNDCEGMSPKVKKTMPRRSKRKQGIELSSEVGLQVHRRSKKNVTQKVDIGEQEHEENLAEKVHIEQQEHESVAQEHESVAEETVADVLGSDLAAEEQEIDEQADEEDTQPNDEEVHQPVHEDMGPEEAAAGEEEQVHHSTEETQTQQSVSKKRKTRGPTRMRKIAKQHDEKVDVEFTSIGEHVGNGSVSLSSFLGPLVREHVPVLLDDWRHLSDQTRDTLWEEIQGRFNLTEDWQKDCVFKQMGCVWRASKSKLTTKVRAVKSKAQLLKLKPSNIESVSAWNAWVKNRNTSAFKEISEKYRKLRQAQIPHTTSRKGMNRLAHEMKKKSSNPKLVTRSKVWVAGHTHSDGRPVRPEFAETIEKIKSIDSEMGSSSTTNLKDDAVSQVLGKDKPGRLRGMGRGVTATKLAFMLARDSHVEKLEASQADLRIKLEELQDVLTGLTGKKDQCEEVSKSEASDYSKGVRCQLLDWCSEDDVVVGEGEFCSAEQWYKIGRIPLGRHAAAVIVKSVSDETASLWRPTPSVFLLGGALGTKIAWPFEKIILDNDADSPIENKTAGSSATDGSHTKILIIDWNLADSVVAEGRLCSTDKDEMVNNMPLGHSAGIVNVEKVFNKNAYLWRPSPGKFLMKDVLHENIAWPLQSIQFVNSSPRNESAAADKRPSPPLSLSNSTGSTGSKSVKKKCILLDCKNSREKVAEGRVCPSNPSDTVHHMPLGANASKVWVEVSKVGDAAVWRPNSEIQTIADAVGETSKGEMAEQQLGVLKALDVAKTQLYHFTAIVIAGMGFFTDAYDLFCVSLVTKLLGRLYYFNPLSEKPGTLPPHVAAAVNGVALCGTLAGQLFFGWLGDKLGRKKVYGITLIMMIVCSVASGLSLGSSAKGVLLGFGIGGDYPLSATIMSEYANKKTRGAFIAAVFAMQGVGILAGGFVALAVSTIFDNKFPAPTYAVNRALSTPPQADYIWRIIVMFGALPAALTYYWRMKMPETARYTALVAKNIKQATEDMSKVLQVDLEMEERAEEVVKDPRLNYGLFSKEFARRHGLPLLGCTSTWFLLDIAFYSQNLFQKDIFSAIGWIPKAATMNGIHEVFMIARAQTLIALCSTVPGYWFTVAFIDIIGRFAIQLMGFFMMTVFMFAIAFPYNHWIKPDNRIGFVIMYSLTFFFANFGPNATTFIVPAEIFPARLRSTCHGISAATGKAGAIVGAFGFLYAAQSQDPKKTDAGYPPGIGVKNSLIMLGVINFVGMLFTFLVPEPKGKSLEELSDRLSTGAEFHSWRRSVRMALNVRNKLGFVDGTIPKPPANHGDSASEVWKGALDEELQAMEQNGTWSVTSLPPGKNVVGYKWVFTIKYNSDGTIERYKARLVAKGFTQQEGVDFNETFSPVAKLTSVKLMLGLATKEGWELTQMDVSNAFLHSEIDEEIYMSLPQGYTPGNNAPNAVCRLV